MNDYMVGFIQRPEIQEDEGDVDEQRTDGDRPRSKRRPEANQPASRQHNEDAKRKRQPLGGVERGQADEQGGGERSRKRPGGQEGLAAA
jgi:hypothetical protein